MPPMTLEDAAGPFLVAHPASCRLGLRFGDATLDVVTNSQKLVERLAGYYAEFLRKEGPARTVVTALEAPAPVLGLELRTKEPDPGKTRVKEAFADLPGGRVVRKLLTGMTFFFGDGLNLAVGPCLENDNQVVNFINNRFIERELARGSLLAHASGVARAGRGVALAGFAGMGKSTLALHMMNLGLCFVSNDRLMVRPTPRGPRMLGVAKAPRVNPGTILTTPNLAGLMSDEEQARLATLSDEELWRLESKYDAAIDRFFGPGRFLLEAGMVGLVVLNWSRGSGGFAVRDVALTERRDLLRAFMKDAGLFVAPGCGPGVAPSEEDYVRALAGIRVLELGGHADFPAAAAALEALFFSDGGRAGFPAGASSRPGVAGNTPSDPRRNPMSKHEKKKVKIEEAVDVQEAAVRLEQMAAGLKSGALQVSAQGESVLLRPAGMVELEIKASQKGDKEKIALEFSWRSQLQVEPTGEADTGEAPAATVPAAAQAATPDVTPASAAAPAPAPAATGTAGPKQEEAKAPSPKTNQPGKSAPSTSKTV